MERDQVEYAAQNTLSITGRKEVEEFNKEISEFKRF